MSEQWMDDEQRRAAAAESLAKRKQALRKKNKAKKIRALICLIIAGLILLLVMAVMISNLIKGRQEDTSKKNAEAVEKREKMSSDIVIGLKGSAVQIVLQGEPYIENGAFAIDRSSGAIPEGDIKIKGKVDTSKPGEYEVTYKAGRIFASKSVTRTVRVVTEEEFGKKPRTFR